MSKSFKPILILSALFLIGILIVIGLGNSLVPLLISFGLSYLFFPLVKVIEKRNIKRHWAVIGVFTVITLLSILSLVIIIPVLFNEAKLFFNEIPQIIDHLLQKIEATVSHFGYNFQLSQEGIRTYVIEHISGWSGEIFKSAGAFLKNSFSGFIDGLLTFLNIFMIPLFFFHLVEKHESISAEIKELIPYSWRDNVQKYVAITNSVLSGYVRGQVVVAMLLATLYSIGFAVVGLRFGFFIGLMTGLLSIIPFVGSVIGLGTALVVAFINYNGFPPIVGILVVFVVVQALEGLIITPKLVGDKVGLGALPTMLALIIGGNLLGLAGMIIAIPAAAILKNILIDLKSEYKNLDFYKNK